MAGFELLPRTAEIGIRASGASLEEVFEPLEEHEVGGRRRTLCVHRKGATRALGPGHPELPDPTCHGAGRAMSRTAAKKAMSGPRPAPQAGGGGVVLAAANWKLLSKEDANR